MRDEYPRQGCAILSEAETATLSELSFDEGVSQLDREDHSDVDPAEDTCRSGICVRASGFCLGRCNQSSAFLMYILR